MLEFIKKSKILSSNCIKILACIFMLFDHIGLIFYPNVLILRIIGRLAFPIFAFAISEGARYTKNKLRYFLTIFCLAFLIQVFYYFYSKSLDMSILVTFSFSILLIYSLNLFKDMLFAKEKSLLKISSSLLLFISLIIFVFRFCQFFFVDYSFTGILVAVIISIFNSKDFYPNFMKKLDNLYVKLLLLIIALILVYIELKWLQLYALFSVVILFFYSGKRGRLNIKYFFYVFYPLHLVVLQALTLI